MAEALNTFLAMEAVGSPIEAARTGGPMNGVDPQVVGGDVSGYPRDLMELHAKLVRYFEEAERGTEEERRLAERDRDYVDNFDDNQWTEREKEILRLRGQPVTTTNYVRRKVELLSGLERKSRTDPKAYPRTPSEEDRANAATDTLRYVADACDFPTIRSEVYSNLLVEGSGGAEAGLEDDGQGGANIVWTHVPWDRTFRDPHSRKRDYSDARYKGIVIWMDQDELLETYPDAEAVVADSFSSQFGTYEDKPGTVAWQDNTRQRSRVVQIYWREAGMWWGATITRAGFVAEPWQSPFVDRKKRPVCPLQLQSAYVDREGRRFGMARDLISQQNSINKRESKSLHLLSVSQVIADQGAVEDEDKARREAAKPDGWITKNPGFELTIQRGGDLATGQFQMLQHAIAQMQASGPNASMSGDDPRQLSGRAILAQQAGGAAANEPLADSLRQWSRRIYEISWMAVRQYWTGERWISVTDDLDALKWVGLNRKVTLKDELAAMPEERRAMAMQQMQLMPGDPRLDQVLRIENEINDLDVDIKIEEGQDVPALQAEEFQALMQLAGAQPGLIPGDVLIAASQLRNKGELLKRMKAAQEAQGQTQQQQAAMAQAGAHAEVRVKETQADLNAAKALDTRHGAAAKIAQVHQMAAESPVIPVDGPGLQPEMPPPG